jgi:uncharacterized protein YgiM (DUF1202 family)
MVVRTRQVRQHGLAKKSMGRALAAALAMLVCIAVPTAGSALAAPAPNSSDVPIAEVALGGGTYRVTASVFAEGTDGQVGTQASSGHWIQPNDNLVALPACTESSCPWVPVGTGVEGAYGPQTECAEADGLCWVEIVSDTTGECTVAPVHDRGPLFVRDNWWATQSLREYNVPQGIPAAEYARDGTNFGYGAGISDAGHDIRNVYTYAAGIDLAGGTWQALDLPVSAGITTVTVTMLWQVGITHDEACGNAPDPEPTPNPTTGNATVIDGTLNLRSGPSYSASIVTVMPGNSRVTVTGGSQSGFYPVTFGGTSGWALGTYLDIDAGEDPGSDDDDPPPTGEIATVIDGELNLRSSASTGGSVLAVMSDGATVTLTGQSSNGFLSVSYQGTAGWAYAIYLSTGDAPPPSNGGTATVIDGSLNLRASASTSAGIVTVMPDGATVSLSGQTSNGFSRVTWHGSTGWAYSIYLSTGDDDGGSGNGDVATVFDGALNLRSGAGAGYSVLRVLPDGARVALTGSTSNGFSQVIYQGTTGWASSQWLTTGGSPGSTATVIDGELNLRASASTGASVLLVLPDGATVTIDGAEQNGFLPVTYQGSTGWAFSVYLR